MRAGNARHLSPCESLSVPAQSWCENISPERENKIIKERAAGPQDGLSYSSGLEEQHRIARGGSAARIQEGKTTCAVCASVVCVCACSVILVEIVERGRERRQNKGKSQSIME